MEELKKRLGARGNITLYLSPKLIESIHKALDIPYSKPLINNGKESNGRQTEEEEYEEVAEDIRF